MYNNFNSHYNSHYGSTGGSGAGSGAAQGIMGRMDDTAAVALLQHLGKEDLQHLMADDGKLNDLIQDLQQVRSVQVDHDNLVAQNKSLAEYNLSLQPRLDTLKTDVATGYESINTLKTELGMGKAELDQYVGNQKLETLHALLQTASAEVDEQSEELACNFCEQSVSLEEFLAQYSSMRTLVHKRRIKAEKMGELLRQNSSWPTQGGVASNSSWPTQGGMASNPAPYPTGPSPSAVPYPVGGGFGMPQPSMYRP